MRGHDITEQPSRVRRAGLGGRRVPPGPQPVRPRVVAVGVRPVQPARPAWPAVRHRSPALTLLGSSLLGGAQRAGQRVLDRPAPAPVVPSGARERVRRVLAATGLVVVTAAAVVLLGLLADAVTQSRAGAPAGASLQPATGSAPAVVTVTVGPEATVWDVARGVAPAAPGPELAGLAERIVVDNDLSSVRVHPGQVLRVTAG
jgi:hypothetical protein